MARKRKHEEHENHERWLVSYADFITLLFAFFTSMYAISSVNEGKFRILSESLAVAFNPAVVTSTRLQEGPKFVREQRSHVSEEFRDMFANNYQKVQAALSELQANQKLTLMADENKITIRISESMLFEPGTDRIMPGGLAVIDEVAAVLRDLPNSVRIEGHTDNVPVSTPRFPSNWDLSSARALSILKYFIATHGYDPKKLSALGFGEYRPADSNDTPSGRLKNRRVDIMVLNGDSVAL